MIRLVIVLALSLAGMVPVYAQSRPPVCNELEAMLFSMQRPQRGLSTQNQRLQSAIHKQAGEMRQLEADMRRAGATAAVAVFSFSAVLSRRSAANIKPPCRA